MIQSQNLEVETPRAIHPAESDPCSRTLVTTSLAFSYLIHRNFMSKTAEAWESRLIQDPAQTHPGMPRAPSTSESQNKEWSWNGARVNSEIHSAWFCKYVPDVHPLMGINRK